MASQKSFSKYWQGSTPYPTQASLVISFLSSQQELTPLLTTVIGRRERSSLISMSDLKSTRKQFKTGNGNISVER